MILFKYITLKLFLFYSVVMFSQEKKEESALSFFTGAGYIPFSSSMNNYFKPTMGGSMSLDLYKNQWAYYLSINGTWTKLRQDIVINNDEIWSANSKNSIFSYGLSIGYSVYNKGKFRITPFAGLMLTQSKPKYSDLKEYKYLEKFDVGPSFAPDLGLNLTFHFKNTDSQAPSYGPDSRFSINARITYVPLAVRNKELPYNGHMWYLAIGISAEVFTKN